MNGNMIVTAIRDKIAENFGVIQIEVNDATAKRNFAYTVQNTPTMQFSASDLELYLIGEFDIRKGVLVPVQPAVLICRGDEVLNA